MGITFKIGSGYKYISLGHLQTSIQRAFEPSPRPAVKRPALYVRFCLTSVLQPIVINRGH